MTDNELKSNEKVAGQAKWYIITSINGNEDTVYKNIEDKVRAYKLEDVVQEMRLLKTREITVEVFDPINNPPPSRFRNTKSITWETLPGNRYKKTRIREINRFPGYIYVKMVMADDAWYIIRNTFGVTGFVGSSGKGAKPIPMSDIEVENLFDPAMNKDIVINKTPNVFVEQTVNKPKEPEKRIEFLEKANSGLVNEEGFFDSHLTNNKELEKNSHLDHSSKTAISDAEKTEIQNNLTKPTDEEKQNEENQFLTEHNQIIVEKFVTGDPNINTLEVEKFEIFEKGSNQEKNPFFLVGNTVEILDGPMQGDEGVIKKVDVENKVVKVSVNTLGREMIIDIDFSKVRKKD